MLIGRPQNFTDILEPFCNGPKTEVALINTVQVYSYEDTRIIKAFPQILKVHLDCFHRYAGMSDTFASRFCTTRTVSLIKLLSIGTRRARSRRAGSTSCRPRRRSSRYAA